MQLKNSFTIMNPDAPKIGNIPRKFQKTFPYKTKILPGGQIMYIIMHSRQIESCTNYR